MLILGNVNVPLTAAELVQAITTGFARLMHLPSTEVVEVRGESGYPDLSVLRVNLTQGRVSVSPTAGTMPPPPPRLVERQPGPRAATLRLSAHPLLVEGCELEFAAHATDATLEFGRTPDGRLALALSGAADGRVELAVSEQNLERLVTMFAAEAAAAHGVTVTSVRLRVTQLGERSLAIAALITAKKFVSAEIIIEGALHVGDDLTARLSNLKSGGSGVLATLVGSLLQPQLKKLEGRAFSLAQPLVGELALRDLKLRTDGGMLRVEAAFGSSR